MADIRHLENCEIAISEHKNPILTHLVHNSRFGTRWQSVTWPNMKILKIQDGRWWLY